MSEETFDLSEYLTNKKDSILEEKTFIRVQKPKIELEPRFEPYTSWYRGIAELLKGSSVRGTKLRAIDSIIGELEKRKAQLLNKE